MRRMMRCWVRYQPDGAKPPSARCGRSGRSNAAPASWNSSRRSSAGFLVASADGSSENCSLQRKRRVTISFSVRTRRRPWSPSNPVASIRYPAARAGAAGRLPDRPPPSRGTGPAPRRVRAGRRERRPLAPPRLRPLEAPDEEVEHLGRGGGARRILARHRDERRGARIDAPRRRDPAELDVGDELLGLLRRLVPELLAEHVPEIAIEPEGAGGIAEPGGRLHGRAAPDLVGGVEIEQRQTHALQDEEVRRATGEILQQADELVLQALALDREPGAEGGVEILEAGEIALAEPLAFEEKGIDRSVPETLLEACHVAGHGARHDAHRDAVGEERFGRDPVEGGAQIRHGLPQRRARLLLTGFAPEQAGQTAAGIRNPASYSRDRPAGPAPSGW